MKAYKIIASAITFFISLVGVFFLITKYTQWIEVVPAWSVQWAIFSLLVMMPISIKVAIEAFKKREYS